jgi:hypothetical protein
MLNSPLASEESLSCFRPTLVGAGFIPARKEPIVPLIPALESLTLGCSFGCHLGSCLLADKHTKKEGG